jgi:hypothetical protein
VPKFDIYLRVWHVAQLESGGRGVTYDQNGGGWDCYYVVAMASGDRGDILNGGDTISTLASTWHGYKHMSR